MRLWGGGVKSKDDARIINQTINTPKLLRQTFNKLIDRGEIRHVKFRGVDFHPISYFVVYLRGELLQGWESARGKD